MNDLHLDLNENSNISKVKRWILTSFGIAFCIIGILKLAFNEVTISQIISSFFNFLLGFFFIILGNPKIFKWTKCFMTITNSDIDYKLSEIHRKRNIKWDSVKSLVVDFNKIYFNLENRTIKLNLAFVLYPKSKMIKQSILEFGKEKGIEIVTIDKTELDG